MAGYKVVVPLVITKREDGSNLYLYENAVLPDFVSDDEVKRLQEEGFVEKLSTDSAKSKPAPTAPSN
jgi:hypothetical protein